MQHYHRGAPSRHTKSVHSVEHTKIVHPYLSFPNPRAFAHRGWHVGDLAGMENSMSAFRRAVQEGYKYIETDVHATSDGVVVTHHDETLDRTTDGTGPIASMPWSQVRRAKVGGVEPISRLEEVFEELPDAHFNIDVKADSAAEPVVRAIQRAGATNRVALASFSSRRLARLRKLAGAKLATAMGPRHIATMKFSGRLPSAPVRKFIRGLMAQVPHRFGRFTLVDRGFVRAAHRLGAEVHVWTVNDPAQMRHLLDLGVDGIVTDRPDLLRDVLRERGAWYAQN
ncbi:glycerophosphodiester phosphodiesterase [Thermocrispum agreste]|uniref:glycerophosphodiester phosphodiesterase n=1 Tax=Thermocrispum agreste TaxID=37925 RepID=UPI000423F38D|nr:glycerophosphodiester phosphodiesterase [Thermocrispum agreste]